MLVTKLHIVRALLRESFAGRSGSRGGSRNGPGSQTGASWCTLGLGEARRRRCSFEPHATLRAIARAALDPRARLLRGLRRMHPIALARGGHVRQMPALRRLPRRPGLRERDLRDRPALVPRQDRALTQSGRAPRRPAPLGSPQPVCSRRSKPDVPSSRFETMKSPQHVRR
jgi:hypothetical protein